MSNKIDAASSDSRVLTSMLGDGCFNLRTVDSSSLPHQSDDVANIFCSAIVVGENPIFCCKKSNKLIFLFINLMLTECERHD